MIGAALAIYGWHVGAFITGAGALYVAAFGGWAAAYGVAGVLVGFMAVTTLIAREPERPASATTPTKSISQWLRHAAIAPLTDFFKRLGWLSILVLGVIVFYKFGDAMVGRMSRYSTSISVLIKLRLQITANLSAFLLLYLVLVLAVGFAAG